MPTSASMNPSTTRALTLAAVTGSAAVALRPDFTRVAAEVTAPQAWSAELGADRLLAELGSAVVWLVAVWLLIGLLTASAAALPGAAGRLAARIGSRVLPIVVRRLIVGSAGLGVLLAPVAAGAASTHTDSSTPAPRWPQWPIASTSLQHSAPSPTPGHPAPSPTSSPQASNSSSALVHRGDSLWLIAERRLGPHATARQTAREWPRWYAMNRLVIGDDPDHITPGQHLDAPVPEIAK